MEPVRCSLAGAREPRPTASTRNRRAPSSTGSSRVDLIPPSAISVEMRQSPTGWTINVTHPPDKDPPALPTKCPRCDEDWDRPWAGNPNPAELNRRSASCGPVSKRSHQVLADSLLRELYLAETGRKIRSPLTDSRQDAAKLCGRWTAALKDTVRQLVAEAALEGDPVAGRCDPRASYLEAMKHGREPSLDQEEAHTWLTANYPAQMAALATAAANFANEAQKAIDREFRARAARGQATIAQLSDKVEGRLVNLGMKRGGPGIFRQTRREPGTGGERPWTTLYSWSTKPVQPLSPGDLTEDDKESIWEQAGASSRRVREPGIRCSPP